MRGLQLPAGLFDSTPELEVLVACRAGLSEFPTAVLAAGGLTRLSLGSNSLSSIPVEVTQLTRWAQEASALVCWLVHVQGGCSVLQ